MIGYRRISLFVFTTGIITACGTGGEPRATTPSPADLPRQIEVYRDCLVRNGVTLLDYPTDEGLPQIDKNRTPAVAVETALESCRTFLPAGGEVAKPAPADIQARQRFAACIREHGIPGYPDPDPVTGDPRIGDALSAQLKNDPKMPDAQQACQSVLPAGQAGKDVIGG